MTKSKKKSSSKINRLLKRRISRSKQLYTFDMTFKVDHINSVIEHYRVLHQLSDDQPTPVWVVIDAYEQQDLILALKLCLLCDAEYWDINAVSYAQDPNNLIDLYEVNFSITLPKMGYTALMLGDDLEIKRANGQVTKWSGLHNEMVADMQDDLSQSGKLHYEYLESVADFKCDARFIGDAEINAYEYMLKLRNEGKLINMLKMLEKTGDVRTHILLLANTSPFLANKLIQDVAGI